MGSTAARHTSQEFVAFLADLVASQPRRREIHIIADNFSAHKTKLVQQFLDAHPKVQLHYTPTYSSWLNQVELWFAKIERDVPYGYQNDQEILTRYAGAKARGFRKARILLGTST